MCVMKLGFFGCGNMGESFLNGILKKAVCRSSDIIICEKTAERRQVLKEKYSVAVTTDSKDIENCDILFLGFKPQNLADIQFAPKEKMIVISMLVGKNSALIAEKFPQTKIARIMPNVGQFVGKGMTGLFFDVTFTESEQSTVRSLLESGGKVLKLEQEEQIDAMSTISGSGPAYFFRFAEAMQRAGEKFGFTPEQSELLVKQTLIGVGEILQKNPDDSCSVWREKVTSPKGSTEQALRIFNEANIDSLVQKASESALKRTEELQRE